MENDINQKLLRIKSQYLSDDFIDTLKLKYTNFRVGSKRKSQLLEKIASRLADGDSIVNVLDSLYEAYKSQQPKSQETKFVKYLADRYRYRPVISYMLAPFFDKTTIGVAYAIEKKTAAYKVIRICVSQLQRKQQMRGAGFLGIVGPIIGVGLIMLICSLAHLYIYAVLFKGLNIKPTPIMTFAREFTKTVYELSPFITGTLVIYGTWVVWSLPNQINRRLTKLPPWNVVDAINSAITLQTFNALLKVGMPSSEALKLVGSHSTPYVKHWCQKMRLNMIGGKSEGQALACDFFSKEPRIEIESYATTSDFTNKLDDITEEVFANTEMLVKKLTTGIMLGCMMAVLTVNAIVGLSISSIGQTLN
ncbi:hypothetical protein ACTN3U_003427 [Vibrio alginolyticus]